MIDSTTAIQFSTPVAVIIAAIYQQMIANKVLTKQKEVGERVDEVHVLTNDRMTKMITEIADLKEQLAHNQISSMDERLSRIEATSQAAAFAANKAATIVGAKP